jgi:hypothetical protein
LSQTESATKTDLQILTDRGIPAVEYMAEAYKKTTSEIYDASAWRI